MARRVLVVDDSMLMRRLVREALVSDGWEIAGEAADGVEAVVQYKLLRPDAVTLDLTMPNCTGLEAFRQILHIDPSARIVVLSALNQDRLTAEMLCAGARGFVVKPFQPDRLQEALRASLKEPVKT
jgi:two-component system, chemotaxis family, chemotaxis protein CheY